MAVQLTAHALDYAQWLAVLDALEPTATTQQRDDAQDTLQSVAPRPWIHAAEAREAQR